MVDPHFIDALLNQSGLMIFGLGIMGWVLCTVGIYRANEILAPILGSPVDDTQDQLKISILYAWPIYWLMILFVLVDRNLAWAAVMGMLPTLLVLPAVLTEILGCEIHRNLNKISSGFLVFVLLSLCGSGIGLDREFSRLDGHFILTLLLLYLWWDWGKKGVGGGGLGVGKISPKILFFMGVYQAGALVLLLTVKMLAFRFHLPAGIILGLLLAGGWSVSLVKTFTTAGQNAGFLITSLPLAMLFLLGPLSLVFGSVDFPITLWQMEICTGLLLTLLWLGLAMIDQPMIRSDRLFLLVLCMAYLGVRIFRLF
ncbi:MAG: hypothetical protein WC975_15245 [Phycisphaerae bacterium]